MFGESISATTDANGRFTLQNVPNGDVFFTTEASGHWGFVDYYAVPDGTGGAIGLNMIPDAEITRWEGILGRSINASDGAVDILYYDGAEGGETGAVAPPMCHIDETQGTEYPIIAKSLTIVCAWCEPAQ